MDVLVAGCIARLTFLDLNVSWVLHRRFSKVAIGRVYRVKSSYYIPLRTAKFSRLGMLNLAVGRRYFLYAEDWALLHYPGSGSRLVKHVSDLAFASSALKSGRV